MRLPFAACANWWQRPRHPVVVVSALAKVTDQFMNAGGAAAAGQLDSAREILQVLHQRHQTVASALVEDDERSRLVRRVRREFQGLGQMLLAGLWPRKPLLHARRSICWERENLSPPAWCTPHCGQSGVNAALVDARKCIVTDAAHARATPLWEETNERLQAVVLPL